MSTTRQEGWNPITTGEAVARGLSCRGRGYYKLKGGAIWTAPDVFGPEGNLFPGFCDCSGFVAWALAYRRRGFSTNGIVADAIGARTRFREIGAAEAIRPGDVIVKAGPDLDGNGRRDYPGHVGLITGVRSGFRRGGPSWWRELEVTHCSGRGQLTRDPATGGVYGAVRTTDAVGWKSVGYLVRPLHVEPGAASPETLDRLKRIAAAVALTAAGKAVKR